MEKPTPLHEESFELMGARKMLLRLRDTYRFAMKAQASGQPVTATCSIGDESLTFIYADGHTDTLTVSEAIEQARLYVLTSHGSFEKMAEYGLIS